MASRPPNDTQVSTGLPGLQRHITTHDNDGKAIIHPSTAGQWTSLFNNTMAFNLLYTTSSVPIALSSSADIQAHAELMEKRTLGLTNPNGTVCHIVDFSPGAEPLMHRTQSLDYVVVLEDEVELQLDSGETRRMRRGDVAIQRATSHAWRNTSNEGWARMMLVLMAAEVAGKELGEDLSDPVSGAEKPVIMMALKKEMAGMKKGFFHEGRPARKALRMGRLL